MKDDASVFTELIDIISEKSGLDKSLIKKESLIENDLGLTGEDAEELIKKISKKFNVDLSRFVFSKYFNDEPSLFTANSKVSPLTVGDIENAVNTGYLV